MTEEKRIVNRIMRSLKFIPRPHKAEMGPKRRIQVRLEFSL